MGLINLIVGLIFIALGFLVRVYPGMLAGYNTMSAERKKNIDIEGLTRFMRNGLILMGLAIILLYLVLRWIDWSYLANMVIILVVLTGSVILFLTSGKFDHNPEKKSRSHYIVLGIVLLLLGGVFFYGFMTTKTQINGDMIRFTGLYGKEMHVSEIAEVELMDTIPRIVIRTNGFSLGTVHKGNFRLEEFGKCRLYINSGKGKYVIVTDVEGFRTILRYKNDQDSRSIYEQINRLL